MENVFSELLLNYPIIATILAVLGSLVVIGQFIIAVTPSKKDDLWLEGIKKNSLFGALMDFLKSFAPFAKKDKKIGLNKK